MSYTHSNHTCGTHIGTFGSYEGEGVGIRTQDCAALIPRESVGLHRGLWGSTGSLPPLRTASPFSLEELSSSQLYLQGPHYLWEPVVPGVSTFFFPNCTERSGAGNRTKHWVLTPLFRFSVLTPCRPELHKRTFAGTSVFSEFSSIGASSYLWGCDCSNTGEELNGQCHVALMNLQPHVANKCPIRTSLDHT